MSSRLDYILKFIFYLNIKNNTRKINYNNIITKYYIQYTI